MRQGHLVPSVIPASQEQQRGKSALAFGATQANNLLPKLKCKSAV